MGIRNNKTKRHMALLLAAAMLATSTPQVYVDAAPLKAAVRYAKDNTMIATAMLTATNAIRKNAKKTSQEIKGKIRTAEKERLKEEKISINDAIKELSEKHPLLYAITKKEDMKNYGASRHIATKLSGNDGFLHVFFYDDNEDIKNGASLLKADKISYKSSIRLVTGDEKKYSTKELWDNDSKNRSLDPDDFKITLSELPSSSLNEQYKAAKEEFEKSGEKKIEYNGNIAIIDTGINSDKLLKAHGVTSQNDKNGHGTMLAKIIAAENPSSHIISLRAYDKDGIGTDLGIALSVYEAINKKADVILLGMPVKEKSSILSMALSYAKKNNTTVICPAGDDSEDTKDYYPTSDNNVIAIGATKVNEMRAKIALTLMFICVIILFKTYQRGREMCELFGASLSQRMKLNKELKEFYSHCSEHPNGWGLAVSEDGYMGIEKESLRADKSSYLKERLKDSISGLDILAHIRYATIGNVERKNSHPFCRVDNSGRRWVLIHNGTIFDYEPASKYVHTQQGETDSERILMYIVDCMNEAIQKDNCDIDSVRRCKIMEDIITDMAPHNKLNLLIFDGDQMYVHTNYRDSLYLRHDLYGVVFSTRPLSLGTWENVPMCTLFAYSNGQQIYEGKPHDGEYHEDKKSMETLLMAYSNL